jgi:hypothetical protein
LNAATKWLRLAGFDGIPEIGSRDALMSSKFASTSNVQRFGLRGTN